MKYLNIKKDLSLQLSEDKIYAKRQLLVKFEEFIAESGYKIKQWLHNSNTPYECLILNKDNEIYDLVICLKNITGAGWKDKLNRKRVQVTNVTIVSPDDYIATSQNRTMLIFGYYNFDNNPIMVAWDAYRYTKHVTTRSAYVTVDNLLRGYDNGYIETTDSSQKVRIFEGRYFDRFLKDYISYNK